MYKIKLENGTEYDVTSAGVVDNVFGTTIINTDNSIVEIIIDLSDRKNTQKILYFVEGKIEEFDNYTSLITVLDRRKTNEGILIRLEKE